MADTQKREILVQKKKIVPEVHGGSAWKVAYADFVTAMMAFFLLLWLLNATTEDQKQGISNYFEPVGAVQGSTGSGGVFGGISATDPGPVEAPGQTTSRTVNVRSQVVTQKKDDISKGDPSDRAKAPNREDLPKNSEEDRQFDAAQSAIRRAMEQVPELLDLFDSVAMEVTEQGLRIRLMDRDKHPLFPAGSTKFNPTGKKLLKMIGEVIERLPNKILVSGHTSADDETKTKTLTNWRISLERAYAGRKLLAGLGTPEARFAAVHGLADLHPVKDSAPNAAPNRRVEITLLRRRPDADPKVLLPPSMVQPKG